ncbi:fimbria/pilus periplasmic chaperone [Caballeronia insecticola]|uniref:fimbria/pilus periplasmic chaperone n=1 Tax=Caballeronia insecticola TaxID=758793 RepID=UPI001E366DE8|nr:fimbria/pilus periplasmic chaperone [Caballeronia insecticola]
MLPAVSNASVVIAATRVVYNATDNEVTLKLSNVGKAPALTQMWLDKGDPKADPSKLKLPFVLTPPIARIDPQKAQTIRISYTGEPMPKDRESLLWFNMLEVPPRPTADQAGPNYVQLAFRSRLKFFYRPEGLQGRADDAPASLTWRKSTQNGKPSLVISNPTPYHVTIIDAQLGEGANAPKFNEVGMVEPRGQLELPVNVASVAAAKVSFTTINDYGGPVKHEAPIQ